MPALDEHVLVPIRCPTYFLFTWNTHDRHLKASKERLWNCYILVKLFSIYLTKFPSKGNYSTINRGVCAACVGNRTLLSYRNTFKQGRLQIVGVGWGRSVLIAGRLPIWNLWWSLGGLGIPCRDPQGPCHSFFGISRVPIARLLPLGDAKEYLLVAYLLLLRRIPLVAFLKSL